MPPKAAASNSSKAGEMYSADVVAAVLYATGTTSLSMKNFELMSSLDGIKIASAFQHDFRSLLAKTKELKARIEHGEVFHPVAPTNKRVDTVAVLLMALDRTSISKEQLNMMSALDGTRTPSSFEHQFRPIIAKTKELKKRVADGETFAPVPAEKRGTTTLTTPRKRKGDDAGDTPIKKTKGTPKSRTKKTQPQPAAEPSHQPSDDDDELPADMADFIKSEKTWEEQFV